MSEPVSSTLCTINPLTQGRSSDQLQVQTQPWDSDRALARARTREPNNTPVSMQCKRFLAKIAQFFGTKLAVVGEIPLQFKGVKKKRVHIALCSVFNSRNNFHGDKLHNINNSIVITHTQRSSLCSTSGREYQEWISYYGHPQSKSVDNPTLCVFDNVNASPLPNWSSDSIHPPS